MYYFMKHPNQGFVKGVKEESPDIIKQLETQGWYRCQSRSDTTPYEEPKKKKDKK